MLIFIETLFWELSQTAIYWVILLLSRTSCNKNWRKLNRSHDSSRNHSSSAYSLPRRQRITILEDIAVLCLTCTSKTWKFEKQYIRPAYFETAGTNIGNAIGKRYINSWLRLGYVVLGIYSIWRGHSMFSVDKKVTSHSHIHVCTQDTKDSG